MPARRKPLQALELSGALAARPSRYKDRHNEPNPTASIGNPPSHLDTEQRKLWREIVRTAPAGVLTKADRLLVELGVIALGRLRAGMATKPAELSLLLNVLSRMGLSPVDRTRVSVPPPPPSPDDPWAKLLAN